MKKMSLVILAAGLGTRFKNGIKQLTPVGPSGELLIEYSISDAVEAGFDKVIFIIRREIEADIRRMIGDKLTGRCEVVYCYQDISSLPEGFTVPEGRTKPWGTVHAVLAAKDCISGPFVIINADDYYGTKAYKDLFAYLTDPMNPPRQQCMGGFILKNTLSPNGTVTRGVCTPDETGMLSSVTETYKLSRHSDGQIVGMQNGAETVIPEDSIVSMNMWGCTPEILPMLEKRFAAFLEKASGENMIASAEFALPTAFDELLKEDLIKIKILPTHDKWYGMTLAEDSMEVRQAFSEMTEKGIYTSPLF